MLLSDAMTVRAGSTYIMPASCPQRVDATQESRLSIEKGRSVPASFYIDRRHGLLGTTSTGPIVLIRAIRGVFAAEAPTVIQYNKVRPYLPCQKMVDASFLSSFSSPDSQCQFPILVCRYRRAAAGHKQQSQLPLHIYELLSRPVSPLLPRRCYLVGKER